MKSNNTIVIFSCLKIHYSRASLPKTVLTLPKETSSHMFKMAPFPLTLTFNRGDTKYHGGAPIEGVMPSPIMQVLLSHLRVCESELSSWNNFFQSCRGQGSNRGPSDKKASAKSTPPWGTHIVIVIAQLCGWKSFQSCFYLCQTPKIYFQKTNARRAKKQNWMKFWGL